MERPPSSSRLDDVISDIDGLLPNATMAERGPGVMATEYAHSRDMSEILTAQGEYSQLEGGDVWIHINTHAPGQTSLTCERFPFPHKIRMKYKSSVLRASGFELFTRLLDDEGYQMRMLRRLRKENENIPKGLKFILDLGPSKDEEGRMEHLAALSLPPGIIRWYNAARGPTSAPYQAAGGHDDSCSCWKLKGRSEQAEEAMARAEDVQATKHVAMIRSIWDHHLLPGIRDIPEYCEIRHAANVVRLLRAMDGKGLLLDSAPRVFTIAGLARIFEIGPSGSFSVKLRDRVCSWFLDGPNHQIIEALPEESLEIAWNLQLQVIACAAFRVLVGEAVIQNAGAGPLGRGPSRRLQRSPFGRDLGKRVDEDTESLLQNAAASLTRRMQSDLAMLLGDKVFDFLKIKEWAFFEVLLEDIEALGAIAASRILEAANTFKAALLNVFHFWIIGVLPKIPNEPHQSEVDKCLKFYVPLENRSRTFADLYSRLDPDQKVLTATFWREVTRLAYFPTAIDLTDPRLGLLHRSATKLDQTWDKDLPELVDLLGSCLPEATRLRLDGFIQSRRVLFDLGTFWSQLGFKVRAHSRQYFDTNEAPQVAAAVWDLQMSHHLLVALDEREYAFLPLWAGGNDDGMGTVLQEEIPDADMGPAGPGPSFHTGHSQGGESETSSDWGFEKLKLASRTSGTNPTNVVETGDSTDGSTTALTPAGSTAAPSTVGDMNLGAMALEENYPTFDTSRGSRVAALLEEYTRQQAHVRASLQQTASSPLQERFTDNLSATNRDHSEGDVTMADGGLSMHGNLLPSSTAPPAAHSPVDQPISNQDPALLDTMETEEDLLDFSDSDMSGSATPVPSEAGDDVPFTHL